MSPSYDPGDPEFTRKHRQTLRRLQRFSRTMDSKFRIPGLGTRVGWDAIIGLIPGIGDFTGAILSGYVIVEAFRLKAPKSLLVRMGINVLVEFLGGIIPVLGDIFDVYWKANQRNVHLLQEYLERLSPPPDKRRGGLLLVLLAVSIAVVFYLIRLSLGTG